MQHPLWRMADGEFLDLPKLIEVAHGSPDRFHLIVDTANSENSTVSTFFADDLKAAYYAAGGQRVIPEWVRRAQADAIGVILLDKQARSS